MPAPRQQANIPISRNVGVASKLAKGDIKQPNGRRGASSQQLRNDQGHQQPPWKSSLEVAWSYSRSQAHCPQQVGITSPSFTERRWAGPSNAPDITDDEDDDDDDEEEEEFLEDDPDEVDEDDLDEELDEFGVPHPSSSRRSVGRSRSGDGRGRRGSSSSPSSHSSHRLRRGSSERSPRDHSNGGRLQDRQVSRLTQESRESEERSRSRSRSPKRVAASSKFHLPDAGQGSTRRGTDYSTGSPRGRISRSSRDGSRLPSSLSDFPRVGSHYERYSIASSSKDRSERLRDENPQTGRDPVAYQTDENTPLLLSLHRSKSASPTLEGYPGRGDERGRSRSTLVVQRPDGGEGRVRIPSLESSPAKSGSVAGVWWNWLITHVVPLLPCVGRRG